MEWNLEGTEVCFPIVTDGEHGKDVQYIRRSGIIKTTPHARLSVCDWDILASCSPVLEALVRWEPDIKSSGSEALTTFSNDETTITKLTDYMLGCKIKVKTEDLYELLRLSDMLQVDDVFNYCKYRKTQITLSKDNYHAVLKACSLYDFEHPQMDQFIRGNLTELSKDEHILTISPDAVELLLTDEELSYWPMDDRFVFITDWCNVCESREEYFEQWFYYLDLNKIDKDIIEVVIKNDKLVQMSTKCLDKVIAHLCDRQQDKPVPYVFILKDDRIGSNATGFNLEDKQLYKFTFPDRFIDGLDDFSVTTVTDSGTAVSFNESKRLIHEYNINTNVCEEKRIVCQGHFPHNITHILKAGDHFIFIFNAKGVLGPKYGVNRLKQGSQLYQSVKDNGIELEIERLFSFEFVVGHVCFLNGSIIMYTRTFSKRTKLISFNLQTLRMTEIDLEIYKHCDQGMRPLIQCLLPVKEKLLVFTTNEFIVLSLKKKKDTYIIKDRCIQSSNRNRNVRHIFFSDVLIELREKEIRLCYTRKDGTVIKKWHSYDQKRLTFNHAKPVSYAYLNRTRPVCHMMCPHCDPNACQKQELRRHEDLRSRYFDDDEDDDDYDDYYDDDDKDDDEKEDDDPWNKRKLMILIFFIYLLLSVSNNIPL